MSRINLLLALILSTGCVIETNGGDDGTTGGICGDAVIDTALGETCDDGNNVADDGCTACRVDQLPPEAQITANWSLKQQATGQIIPCPPNITVAAVYTQLLDASSQPVGSPNIDLFTCGDSTGIVDVEPGVYQTWVSLTSQGGGTVHATSTSADVDVRTVDKTFTVTLLNDGGYFQFDWNLTRNGNPVTCAQAGATGVGGVSTSTANPNMFTDDIFTCQDGTGITGALLQGSYTVSIDALNSAGSISPAPVVLSNRVINDRNRITDLGVIVVPVN